MSEAVQRVVKVRRDYNTWVANESIEDYALRFTPRSFRKWSELRVANTAFGAASFLVLEAVGATMLVNYGFVNAFWAILLTGLVIFLAGLPISLYAARYGLDMDLLTRGAGFGYIGSTLTSLIYASFTFIFFALEAAIMAYALELMFDIPPAWGYLICALVVIPLVTHGVTAISKLQVITQPLWLAMLVVPYWYVWRHNPNVLDGLVGYGGEDGSGSHFNLALFGGAVTVGVALITQMGEQVDYLRFMPERTAKNHRRWLVAVMIGGPGWVILGVLKMLGGALLAYLAISNSVSTERAVDPNQMYLIAWEYVLPNAKWAIAATALFVVISQLKINVTNAYAGSLAWSNFFARLTHSHPGRVVWVVFNTMIALMLMELDVFKALGEVLGLYSNVAISWIMVVVADLVINKPMGWSPKGIEFRRAYLYDVNPVGVGAMLLASTLSVAAFVGLLGETLQPFSAFIATLTALTASPLIAWATGGRYYLARERPNDHPVMAKSCCICERIYESDDISHCPAYQGPICSLCCALDARCDDLCKPDARLSAQWNRLLQRLLPAFARSSIDTGLGHYLLLMMAVAPLLALMLGLMYYHEVQMLDANELALVPHIRHVFLNAYGGLLLLAAIVTWWLALTHKSRQVAQEESNRQTHLLMQEIESHKRTDEQLQSAKKVADNANQAKSRYITAISHELRTPLNSMLGYAQILDGDAAIPPHRRQAIRVIRKSGDHLLSVIEGTLDIARIESGKLTLDTRPLDFAEFMQQIVRMFELQAQGKGIDFRYEPFGDLPAVVRADEKRLQQILINVLGNAVKFTRKGSVTLRLRYAREMAQFDIEDTGPGISSEELALIFEPFIRGTQPGGGSGVGLTISKMLTDLMGGEINVSSAPGIGSNFQIRLFLPQVHTVPSAIQAGKRQPRAGYSGERRRILIVDNESVDRELLINVLAPLGFHLDQAASGTECLEVLPRFQPHLIFMDLAMPGIDGWQTIRLIRQQNESSAAIAVISANAFDKGLHNDVDVADEDFILKPVNVEHLLDWIGKRLQLEWIYTDTAAAQPEQALLSYAYPPAHELRALIDLIGLGYVRGILNKLAEIEAMDPSCATFVRHMRELTQQFQLDTLNDQLHNALNASQQY